MSYLLITGQLFMEPDYQCRKRSLNLIVEWGSPKHGYIITTLACTFAIIYRVLHSDIFDMSFVIDKNMVRN